MPATTDADRLAHLWARSDTDLGSRDSAHLAHLTRTVVHRAARRMARMQSWTLTEAEVEDVASDAYLAFRERARAYRERGEEARGGILLLVVADVVQRHRIEEIRAPVPLSDHAETGARPEPAAPDAAPLLAEIDDALRENFELGLRGIARLVARMNRPDPEVEQFARALLKGTTDWQAIESDPVAAVSAAFVQLQGWTPDRVTRVKLRALRRPEIGAMLQRLSSLRGW